MGKRVVHNFKNSLQKSHACSGLPIWETLYRKFFKDFQGMFYHEADGPYQRNGVDRSVTFAHSKQILIDEKVRFKDYGDILLEFISNDARNTPGWVCKPLMADYIAYVVMPPAIPDKDLLFSEIFARSPADIVGKAFMLPVIQLQGAWQDRGEQWQKKFGIRPAHNDGYRTLNTPVPVEVLYPAMGSLLRTTYQWPTKPEVHDGKVVQRLLWE